MKSTILISFITLTAVTTSFSQAPMKEDAKLKAHIIDLENAGWTAFKNKDAGWFKVNTTDEYLQVTEEGTSDKVDVINSLADCNVKSFALGDFKMVMFNKKTLVLIYTATQDGICGGEKLPHKVQVSVNYVKRGGKWLEAFYMDAAVEE